MESHKKDDHMESFFLAETDGYRDILKMADNFSACESTCLYTSQFSGLLLYMSCSSLRRTNQLGKFKGWIGLARAFCAAKSEQTPKLTEPRPPQLQTELRARPPKVKSSQELELEELVKAPKIKARPLNKKILESKGDIGLFSHPKPQITTPQEFHFATDDRLGQPALVVELFDKLSLHSETSSVHWKGEVPRITVLNPFHLHTEVCKICSCTFNSDFSDATNKKAASGFLHELLFRPLEHEVDDHRNEIATRDGVVLVEIRTGQEQY